MIADNILLKFLDQVYELDAATVFRIHNTCYQRSNKDPNIFTQCVIQKKMKLKDNQRAFDQNITGLRSAFEECLETNEKNEKDCQSTFSQNVNSTFSKHKQKLQKI